jgi:hypothetical protein
MRRSCVHVTEINRQTIRLVDCYAAYFGSLTCVAWSPDGRFIIVSSLEIRGPQASPSDDFSSKTGGQDDLVNIFSPWEQRVIARCQGHSSFLSALSFDDLRCDGRTYRFGSVGEDNKLILVNFYVKFLPKSPLTPSCRSGTFRAEYFTVRNYNHIIIVSPWLRHSPSQTVDAPMRSPQTTRRSSSPHPAPRVRSRVIIRHLPATRSRLCSPCS